MPRLFAALLLLVFCGPAAAQDAPDRLAGRYIVSAMESVAEIDLMPGGTFRYGLTVGDLDERARGRWSAEGNEVHLVTLPTPRPPEIKPGAAERDPATKLRITVTLPNGRLVGVLDLGVGFDKGPPIRESVGTTDHNHPYEVDPAPKTGWTLPRGETRIPRWIELGSARQGADQIATVRFPIDVRKANDLTFVLYPNDIGVLDFKDIRVEAVADGLVVYRNGPDGTLFRRVMAEAPLQPAPVAAPPLPPAPLLHKPGEACDDTAGMPKDASVSTPDASLLDGSGVRSPAALERVVGACGEAERAEPNEGRYAHRRGLAFYLLHRRAEAAAEFQRAKALDYPGGYDMVAEGLLFGTMEPAIGKDERAGLALVEQSVARWGLPEMKRTLAMLLRHADPPLRNEARGRRVLEEAAATGHLPAVADLAFVLATGSGGPANPARARKLFEQAVAGGSRYAAGLYAGMLEDGDGFPEDKAAAARMYQLAAERGSPSAMVKLANMMRTGEGVDKDEAGARRWYERAAATGSFEGRRALGVDLILADEKKGKDVERGLQVLADAARDGSAEAAYQLGIEYQAGEFGVPRDVPHALFWLHEAVRLGDADAMAYIGRMYAGGWGVEVDRAEARRWYEKAKAAGSGMAESGLRDLDKDERGEGSKR